MARCRCEDICEEEKKKDTLESQLDEWRQSYNDEGKRNKDLLIEINVNHNNTFLFNEQEIVFENYNNRANQKQDSYNAVKTEIDKRIQDCNNNLTVLHIEDKAYHDEEERKRKEAEENTNNKM